MLMVIHFASAKHAICLHECRHAYALLSSLVPVQWLGLCNLRELSFKAIQVWSRSAQVLIRGGFAGVQAH